MPCSVPYVSVCKRDVGAFYVTVKGEEKYIGTPYLTEYGEEDDGLKLGQMTYLDEKRVPQLIDKYLEFFN